MSTKDFLTYRKFNEEAPAAELCALFKENGMDSIIENNSMFNATFTANNDLANGEYEVKIKPEDFEQADAIVHKHSLSLIDQIERDYHLYEFTDDELMEIILRPHEWSSIDYLLAQKILKERGKNIDPEYLEEIKQKDLNELSQPVYASAILIIFGYIFALLGGLFGLSIGLYLLLYKKVLPNGERIHYYATPHRNHGFIILIIGSIVFTLSVLYRINRGY